MLMHCFNNLFVCEVKSSLAVFAGIKSHPIGFLRYLPNFTSLHWDPALRETDCYMPGADQSGWWFGPEIGGEKASR